MRIAALQLCSGVDAEANLAAIEKLTRQAAAEGANYVLTPEVSLVFAANRDQLAARVTSIAVAESLGRLAEIARSNAVHLHIGSMAIPGADGFFINRSILFGPDGNICAQYDKIHLFDADPPNDRPYRESETYRGGDKAVIVPVGDFTLGMTICYDLRFPALFAALAEAGATLISVPAAFTVPTGEAHWHVLLRARAIETGSYIIAAAQGGTHENGRRTFGHSLIADPWGSIIAEADGDAPQVILADILPERVEDARRRVPTLANRRSFSLSVNHDVLK